MVNIKGFISRVGIKNHKELAERLGIKKGTVDSWSSGERFPTHEMEEKLFRIGMTLEELFGKEIADVVRAQLLTEQAKDADAAFERKANFFLNKIFSKIDKTEIDASKGDDV